MKHLKALLVEKNKTQSQLADALGRDKSAITNLLQGKRQLKASEIPVIAAFLGVNETHILGLPEPQHRPDEGFNESARIPFQGAPSAKMLGSGHLVEENGTYYFEEATAVPEHCFMLEVKDDSLNLAGVLRGDLLLCAPKRAAQDGDIVIVQHYNDDGSAQTLIRGYQPPFLEVASTTPTHAKLHEDRANVAIMATVIRLTRSL
jgi:SOS-response transcriptional repressor LexA